MPEEGSNLKDELKSYILHSCFIELCSHLFQEAWCLFLQGKSGKYTKMMHIWLNKNSYRNELENLSLLPKQSKPKQWKQISLMEIQGLIWRESEIQWTFYIQRPKKVTNLKLKKLSFQKMNKKQTMWKIGYASLRTPLILKQIY